MRNDFLHSLYAPAAGSVRCFVTGWTFSACVQYLRVNLRPGCGTLDIGKPSAVGAALAFFCATWHGARVALWGCTPLTGLRNAAAGTIAGASLALRHPSVAGVHTELHAATTMLGVRLAICDAIRWWDARFGSLTPAAKRVLAILFPLPNMTLTFLVCMHACNLKIL